MNPDCRAEKHKACSGTAWDESADALTACSCWCHEGHEFADEYGGCVRCGAFPGEGPCVTPVGRRPTPPTPGTERITGL